MIDQFDKEEVKGTGKEKKDETETGWGKPQRTFRLNRNW